MEVTYRIIVHWFSLKGRTRRNSQWPWAKAGRFKRNSAGPQLGLTLRGDQGTWERQQAAEFSAVACSLNLFQEPWI